jgi:predicted transcriptional regulator
MSKKLKKPDFEERICDTCHQRITYVTTLSKAHAMIMVAFARAVAKKGVNIVHPHKELVVDGEITSSMRNNITPLRNHELLKPDDTEPGNWNITEKGRNFLQGASVPRWAVVNEITSNRECYLLEEGNPNCWTTIGELLQRPDFWEGFNFEFVEGRKVVPTKSANQQSLL